MPRAAQKLTTAADAAGELADKIAELHATNATRKKLERDEAALKDWFKARSGGKDMSFEHDGIVVKVTEKSKETLDRAAVEALLSKPKFASCLKPSNYVEVSVGLKKESST